MAKTFKMKPGMLTDICNPNTDAGRYRFEASLGYRDPILKTYKQV